MTRTMEGDHSYSCGDQTPLTVAYLPYGVMIDWHCLICCHMDVIRCCTSILLGSVFMAASRLGFHVDETDSAFLRRCGDMIPIAFQQCRFYQILLAFWLVDMGVVRMLCHRCWAALGFIVRQRPFRCLGMALQRTLASQHCIECLFWASASADPCILAWPRFLWVWTG